MSGAAGDAGATPAARIDARGLLCPWPALRLARALRAGPDAVEIVADDPLAPREMAEVAEAAGYRLMPVANAADLFRAARAAP